MGYIRHHAIAVTGYFDDDLKNVHKEAKKIFKNLASRIIKSSINDFATFFIAPDGSKEGWEDSNKYDAKRKKNN